MRKKKYNCMSIKHIVFDIYSIYNENQQLIKDYHFNSYWLDFDDSFPPFSAFKYNAFQSARM